jgi:hypothetical protein
MFQEILGLLQYRTDGVGLVPRGAVRVERPGGGVSRAKVSRDVARAALDTARQVEVLEELLVGGRRLMSEGNFAHNGVNQFWGRRP